MSGVELTGVGTCALGVVGGVIDCDESYVVGLPPKARLPPDFTLKVVEPAHVGAKLGLYRVYGVPEVWFWTGGKLEIRQLKPEGYVPAPGSRFIRKADPPLIGRCMGIEGQFAAVRALREALRA